MKRQRTHSSFYTLGTMLGEPTQLRNIGHTVQQVIIVVRKDHHSGEEGRYFSTFR